MGIESVGYRFKPLGCRAFDLVEFLSQSGATSGGREGSYVLSGPDHWIDLFVRADGDGVAQIEFRMAVTNPASAVSVLNDLIGELVVRFGGHVTDASGRRVLSEAETLDVLTVEFRTGRQRFVEKFGDLTLPVSADQVFSQLRKLGFADGR